MCAETGGDGYAAVAALVVSEYVLGAESGGVVAVVGCGAFAEELHEVGSPAAGYDAGVDGDSFAPYTEYVHVC